MGQSSVVLVNAYTCVFATEQGHCNYNVTADLRGWLRIMKQTRSL